VIEFRKSPAGDFERAPSQDRNASPVCDRTGFTNASVVLRNGVFTYDYFQQETSGAFGYSFPKQDYWKLRITAVVISQPVIIAAVKIALNSRASPLTYQLFNEPITDGIGYHNDGNDFLTGTTFTRAFNSFLQQFVYFDPRQSEAFYTVPTLPGTYVSNYKIQGRRVCHTWFELETNGVVQLNLGPGGSNQYSNDALQIAAYGEHTVTFELLRVFRMIVRYQTSLIAAAVGQSIQFSDLTTTDNTKTAWLWNFGDGTTSTAQNPTKSYAAAGSYQVTLAITDSSEETYISTGIESQTITIT